MTEPLDTENEIARLRADLDTARNHIAELDAYALGCDAEGCTVPHSSWCEVAKKTAAENDGCTCPQPWKDSPQPHAAYCWLVSPPRDEVEEMRRKVAEVIAGRDAAVAERDRARSTAVTLEQETARLEAERDAFRDQRNSVFATNERLHAQMAESDQARLHAENETRTVRRELAKYVGAEPTIAEEMAYLSRCLFAVDDVCDQAEQQATRWESPLPVPEWVATVRAAASGEHEPTDRSALPWAHTMPDDDLHGFLHDLVSAAIDRWRSDPDVPDREILANIEKVCANWRTPGQGHRSDEPGAGEGR